MKISPIVHTLGLAAALLLAGCESIASRIQEKADVFSRLGPSSQEAIKRGHVGTGFTPEMVYMALGKPSRVETSADGTHTVWTYFYFNPPDARFFNVSATTAQTAVERREALMQDPKAQPVPEGAGLRGGEGQSSDPTGRRSTPSEATLSDERQDLHLKFFHGQVTGYELENVVQ